MELTTMLWRAGPDQDGLVVTEAALKNLVSNIRLTLPRRLTLDFVADHRVGSVTAISWDNDDKSVYVTVIIEEEEERKWLGFDFANSIRPMFNLGTPRASESGYKIYGSVGLADVTVCAAEVPARLPDPLKKYL